jgi:hypothetical protein
VLGFSVCDKRYIVLTYLEFDHAGSLQGYPRRTHPRHAGGAAKAARLVARMLHVLDAGPVSISRP